MDENKKEQPEASSLEGESLENPSPDSGSDTPNGKAADSPPGEGGDSSVLDATVNTPENFVAPATTKPVKKGLHGFIEKHNIYLFLLIVVLVAAVAMVAFTYLSSKKNSNPPPLASASLSQGELSQLANSDVSVGDSGHVLNVQSSAIFGGSVLLRQNLEVAGNLQIGNTLSLNNLAISGTAQAGQLQISKDLSVAGNSSVQGNSNVGKSLQVTGGGTFGGPITAPQITTTALQLNGDLILTHHITAGGATPGHSNGSGLGGGGTATLSGSDTSGTINVNTGNSPAAGCFITVNFVNHYNATPHVLVSPVGSSAGGLSYYVNRSTTSFSLCDATAAPAGASFSFDYWVVD